MNAAGIRKLVTPESHHYSEMKTHLKVCCKGQLSGATMPTMMSTVISEIEIPGITVWRNRCTEHAQQDSSWRQPSRQAAPLSPLERPTMDMSRSESSTRGTTIIITGTSARTAHTAPTSTNGTRRTLLTSTGSIRISTITGTGATLIPITINQGRETRRPVGRRHKSQGILKQIRVAFEG